MDGVLVANCVLMLFGDGVLVIVGIGLQPTRKMIIMESNVTLFMDLLYNDQNNCIGWQIIQN